MQNIVSAAVSRLIELGSVDEENRDIYEYGLQMLSSTAVNLAITVTLGFIFGVPLETVMMFIPFTALRSVSGGYHAKSFFGCVAVSAAGMTVTIAAVKMAPGAALFPITTVLSAVAIGLVFVVAPVEHQNRPLEDAEVHKFRKLSRLVVVVSAVASVLFFVLQIPRCGFGISLGIALSCAATCAAALSNGMRCIR